jgi:hypothetical protein
VNRTERNKIVGLTKASRTAYLASIEFSPHAQNLHPRFTNFARKLQAFYRKDQGSLNTLKTVPSLARLLFGLQEPWMPGSC